MEGVRGESGPFPCVDECNVPGFAEAYEQLMHDYSKGPKINFGGMVIFGTGGDYSKDFEEWKELQTKK